MLGTKYACTDLSSIYNRYFLIFVYWQQNVSIKVFSYFLFFIRFTHIRIYVFTFLSYIFKIYTEYVYFPVYVFFVQIQLGKATSQPRKKYFYVIKIQ